MRLRGSILGTVSSLCVAVGALLVVSASVASADNCPNAVFRNGPSSRLPDCRAYEMVTPPYKEGFRVEVITTNKITPALSADGSRVEGESFGVFAGAEDSLFETGNAPSFGALYVFTRGQEGWVPTAISAPASRYPIAGSPFSSSDLSESLWVASTPAQVHADEVTTTAKGKDYSASFYTRRLADPMVEVGPILPPSVDPRTLSFPYSAEETYFTFVGASSRDLSDVFYSMKVVHWPLDATNAGAESLYEYVGKGNAEPLLVGVSGGAGSTSLISKCGTRLAGLTEITNGIVVPQPGKLGYVSEDGSVVLFLPVPCGSSPAVREVYARVDNGLPDAHTVSISEPTAEACALCETGQGVRRDASALGISRDGSKVIFSTAQPMLGGDATNNIYEYDLGGEAGGRVVRVSGGDSTVSDPTANVEGVVNMSPDGSHVYFLASGVLTKTPNGFGQEAQAGHSNLYLYERDAQYPAGRTVFVLPGSDVPGISSVSQNGRFVVFDSNVHLTLDDFSNGAQTFEYDSQTGSVVRVSIGQNGYNHNGNTGGIGKAKVADDGAVFFESGNPLAPQAVNGLSNVYEYRDGNVALISTGQESPLGDSLDYTAPTGADVFIQSFAHLVSQDTDAQVDTYDARAGGGFPPPPAPAPCQADACQGPLSGAPVLLSPGSELQAGGENVLPATPAASVKATGGGPKAKNRPVRKHKKKRGRGARKAATPTSHSRGRTARIGGRS
jgi:hypothetical protein